LLTCEVNQHFGFFSVATVCHWDRDDADIETFERGIDAFRQHAATVARLRQSGWDVVSYTGEAPPTKPGAEIIPAAA
jgi:hypothetical protein